MPSLIPRHPWARRLVYELVYAWPSGRRAVSFNVGFAPVRDDTRALVGFADDPSQLQLYAELCELTPIGPAEWQGSTVLEIAAGRGGGLAYVQARYHPKQAIGIDISHIAAWRGRRLGVDLRQGDATRLRFADARFDRILCLDALKYFPEKAFIGEARRVLRPGGHLLLGDTSGAPSAGAERFHRLAALAGLDMLRISDVSDGVRLAIRQRSARLAPMVARVPWLLRDRWREMAMVEGSLSYERWQAGKSCFLLAALRRPPE